MAVSLPMVAVLVGMLLAIWLVIAGLVMLLAPRLALRAVAGFGSTLLVHFGELGFRLAAGVALVVADPSSSSPGIVAPIGWFLIVSSVVLMLLPRSWHSAYAIWWARRLPPVFLRLVAPIAIAGGLVLMNVLVSGPSGPVALSCAAPTNGWVSGGCYMLHIVGGAPGSGGRLEPGPDVEARVLELAIATGRYGVMLTQVREILRLPEPNEPAVTPSSESLPHAVRHISEQQAVIARELVSDTRLACARDDLASAVRQLACETAGTLPPIFQVPVSPALVEVAARDEALGAFVTRWWGSVCASAPPSSEGEMRACPIE